MTQRQFDSAVARATGESLSTIRHRGFSPLGSTTLEDDREPLVMDWDNADTQRGASLPPSSRQRFTAA
jgi:hypothetical protein